MMIALEFARRAAPWILIATIALLIALAGPAACRKLNSEAARARLGEASARAASRNGEDAVATVGVAARREQQSDALTRTNEKEIRDAQGADAVLDPAVRNAGLGGLCRRPAYRDDQRCRLRRAAAR
ncbi:MAG: hypothetical protein ABIR25_04550 [Sphingomicrobium sp.]